MIEKEEWLKYPPKKENALKIGWKDGKGIQRRRQHTYKGEFIGGERVGLGGERPVGELVGGGDGLGGGRS